MAINEAKDAYLTTTLPIETKTKFRVLCAEEGVTMSNKIRAMIVAEVKRKEKRST